MVGLGKRRVGQQREVGIGLVEIGRAEMPMPRHHNQRTAQMAAQKFALMVVAAPRVVVRMKHRKRWAVRADFVPIRMLQQCLVVGGHLGQRLRKTSDQHGVVDWGVNRLQQV